MKKYVSLISFSKRIFFGFTVGILLISVFYILELPTISKEIDLNQLADQVVNQCVNEEYRPHCYDREITSLMDNPTTLTMEEAFKLSKVLQTKVNDYNFCHVLGHKLAAKETAKDPNNWKEVISRCPGGVCSNGCIHGAFQERFRTEYLEKAQIAKIKPELEVICRRRENWQASGVQQGSCYHALGHLTMYLTNADIPTSLSLCRELAINENRTDFTTVCFDGVFMQIFQPLEPEDFALIAGKAPAKDDVFRFCSSFDNQAFASCWGESWPVFISELKSTQGSINFCQRLPEDARSRCFTNLFYIMPVQFKLDSDKNFAYCKNFSPELRAQCFAQVGQRLVQTDDAFIDRAIQFCQSSITFDPSERCFQELAEKASFNFKKDSPSFQKLCVSLPKSWQQTCSLSSTD